jgi:hypothetical protein
VNILVIVLSIILGLLFLVTGGVKVIGLRQSLAIRDHFGMPATLWRTIGALEVAGAAGTLIGLKIFGLGLLALIGLALLMIGAIVTRVRVHDRVGMILGDVVGLALVVLTAIGRVATH